MQSLLVPRQFPLRQLPPLDISPLGSSPLGHFPLMQFPPWTFPPWTFPPQTVTPWTISCWTIPLFPSFLKPNPSLEGIVKESWPWWFSPGFRILCIGIGLGKLSELEFCWGVGELSGHKLVTASNSGLINYISCRGNLWGRNQIRLQHFFEGGVGLEFSHIIGILCFGWIQFFNTA